MQNAPSGARVVAARYDGGRMTDIKAASASGMTGTIQMSGSGTIYRLMLVDADSIPLCPAATVSG
ncbi:MAG: hypothetical protein E7425_05425 [Ruminococcaceae bacterium]|nr:hypothetical protein [Oscillospiraceae bacterium]